MISTVDGGRVRSATSALSLSRRNGASSRRRSHRGVAVVGVNLRQGRKAICSGEGISATGLVPGSLVFVFAHAGLNLGNGWESQLNGIGDSGDAASADEEAPAVNYLVLTRDALGKTQLKRIEA